MPQKWVGTVISTKMMKTAVVRVVRRVQHPKYRHFQNIRSKFFVHDPAEEARVGDRVRFEQSRPHSKKKAFELRDFVWKYPEDRVPPEFFEPSHRAHPKGSEADRRVQRRREKQRERQELRKQQEKNVDPR